MKIVCISDTHEQHRMITKKLKNIRQENGKFVLCHAGDLTYVGDPKVFEDFNLWIGELLEADVIEDCVAIPGNHDKSCVPGLYNFSLKQWRDQAGRNYERVMKSVKDYHLLVDQSVVIDGIKFYGTPWTPVFGGGWSYQLYNEEDKRRYYDLVPTDTDVWIGHGPPHGICDKVERHKAATEIVYGNEGCKTLLKYIETIKPQVYICGHLHEPKNHTPVSMSCGTTVINAAICDEQYKPIQEPIFFELKNK